MIKAIFGIGFTLLMIAAACAPLINVPYGEPAPVQTGPAPISPRAAVAAEPTASEQVEDQRRTRDLIRLAKLQRALARVVDWHDATARMIEDLRIKLLRSSDTDRDLGLLRSINWGTADLIASRRRAERLAAQIQVIQDRLAAE